MHYAITFPLFLNVKAKTCVSRRVVSRRPASTQRASKMTIEPIASVATLPTLPLVEGGGMAVTFPAYLAVFLGTLIPCAFLVILYIQDESRKAGERAGRGE